MLWVPPTYRVRIRETCQAPLADEFDPQLFEVSRDVHEHMVAVLNEVQKLKTNDLPASATKRLYLFYGQLLNDAAGATFLLAGHGAQHPLFAMMRSGYEYVARALYFSENKENAIAHLMDLWNKEHRLFKDLDAHEAIKRNFEENAAQFMADHPGWKRPTDLPLKDMLVNMYGRDRGEYLYKEYHTFYSGVVHGHFDAVPNVIFFDGQGTHVKPGPDITNACVCFVTRILFTMTCLMKREFGISVGDTQAIYHRFCGVRRRLMRLTNPFPMTRKMLQTRSKAQ